MPDNDLPDYLKNKAPMPTGVEWMEPEDKGQNPVVNRETMNDTIVAGKTGLVLPGTPYLIGKFLDPHWLLKGEPREVQLEALRRSYLGYALRAHAEDTNTVPHVLRSDPAVGWGHFMQMRLGKTPTVLNEFALYRRDFGFKWLVVVVPNAFKFDWPLEAEKFGLDIPSFTVESHRTRELEHFIRKNWETGGLISVNYEGMARSESVNVLLARVMGPKTYVAFDESIIVKGHDSGLFKSALALAKECGARRPLTGKPITQGPHDMWSQLRIARQLDGFNFYAFKTSFCKMGGFKGKAIVGVNDPDELREIIHNAAFVARKTDWLRTPGVSYATRHLEMPPAQKTLYDQMEKDFLVEIEDDLIVSADQIITKLIKMEQIASGFIIDEEHKVHNLVPLDKNPKIQAVKEMLETGITGKTLVVVHHRHSVEMLTEALAAYKPAFILGGQKDVVENKARFNGSRECRVLIGQEQALRYGHTLMGTPEDPCYTTLFFENNYSLNDRSQCEERNQGAGQPCPIDIWDFVVSSQNAKIIEALQKKEDLAALILGYDRATGILPVQDAP